jgi:hypothetical protein
MICWTVGTVIIVEHLAVAIDPRPSQSNEEDGLCLSERSPETQHLLRSR